ncbi:MAG: hypothetical protein QM597_09355 [Aeromicrobium sp.]|uniref:hypothetical protein n=1 Tax=Aeromicrobium sp. TaxID=1871063 RepID=UPI0039E33489
MLLTTRLSRIIAVTVVATVATAVAVTFAFSSDAVGGSHDDRAGRDATPTISVGDGTTDAGPDGLNADATGSSPTPAPDATATQDPGSAQSGDSSAASSDSSRDEVTPTSAPTTKPETATPAPSPTPKPTKNTCLVVLTC